MTPIERLRELMAKATPLYEVPSAYFDRDENESVANLFAKDKPGECVIQVRGDYARDWAKALINLPSLLAVVEAAQAVMDEHPAGYYYHGHQVPGIWDPDNGELAGKACENCAKVFRLRKALAALTTEGQP
jgi:hypothetical protein